MPQGQIGFVDSVSLTAAPRLLFTGVWRVLKAGTDMSPPPFRRSWNSTLLTDGATVPASAYDNRVLRIHLQLDAADPATTATQLQLLHRELDRPTNILRWQPEAGLPPVFFRTYRAPDYEPDIDHGINLVDATLVIPAEPFAFGVREDVPTATVSNDPINTGSNGKFFDITGVKGDVETPLQIRMTGSDATGRQTLFAVRRRGTPSAMPMVLQCEAMTLGTNATTVANGTDYSGAGSNTVEVSFGTATLANRLSTSAFPATGSVDARGTYRVFARTLAVFVGVGANMTLQLRHGVRQIANSSVAVDRNSALTQTRMVDLGLVQIPEGYNPASNGPDAVAPSATGVQLNVYAARTNGTEMVLDYLMFVPADDSVCIVNWGSSTPTTFVLDGTNRMVYGLDSSARIADILTAYFTGDPPSVSPGVTNRIVVIRDVIPSTGNADAPATTYPINCSYWPRYLSVRPVST